jgi:hypothetical protein
MVNPARWALVISWRTLPVPAVRVSRRPVLMPCRTRGLSYGLGARVSSCWQEADVGRRAWRAATRRPMMRVKAAAGAGAGSASCWEEMPSRYQRYQRSRQARRTLF